MDEMALREKARLVFKGLDDYDFEIIRFFYENEGASKYKASRFFEGELNVKPIVKIPRATVYRKIDALTAKGFLKIVGKSKFKKGSLEADVVSYSADTLKSHFAVFGSSIKPSKVFRELGADSKIKAIGSLSNQFEFCLNVFESLSELNVDFTDFVGSELDLLCLIGSALILKKPDYVWKFLEIFCADENLKQKLENVLKIVECLQKGGLQA